MPKSIFQMGPIRTARHATVIKTSRNYAPEPTRTKESTRKGHTGFAVYIMSTTNKIFCEIPSS
jgi:hypothetical protein